MTDFFNYLLIDLLPFWQQAFSLLATISWPVALLFIIRMLQPMILKIFSERKFSFEGFGAKIQVDERKNAQEDTKNLEPTALTRSRLNLPRTEAIAEEEMVVKSAIDQLPQMDRDDVVLNALAIERLEKHFALTYIDIFGSQLFLLQKINERGGTISVVEGEEFVLEVKAKFPELSDWDFAKYVNFLVQRNLIRISTKIELTPAGKDFIHFVIRYGLRSDKGL